MIIALCFSMIIGGTYAWFTDTASLAVNKIQAGKLDIALYYENDDGEWVDAEGKTLGWVQKVESDGTTISKIVEEEGLPLWEPGCTFILPKLKIVNEGNLALKYNVTIRGIKGSAKLNEVIEWTFTLDESEEELGKEHNLYPNGSANGASENIFTLSGHMLEEAGNEYQGLSIEGIGITVSATQLASEFDSHDNQYDKDAVLPVAAKAIGNLTVETDGSVVTTASEQVLSDSVMSVTYPAGVKLNKTESDVSGDEEKKTSAMQELAYVDDAPSASMAGISIDSGKAVAQYDLTLPVSDENDVLVTTTIKYVQGLTGVEVYHSGVKLPNEAEAGEYFTYDSESGVLTLYLYHASPIDIVSDKPGIATVTTADELKKAIDNENVSLIKLGADIELTEVLDIKHSVTIDFCGKTINASGDEVNMMQWAIDIVNNPTSSNKLTFKDSVGGGVFHSTYGGIALWSSRAQFELNDVTIESDKGYAIEITSYALVLDENYEWIGWGEVSGASIVINSGKIITPANGGNSNGAIHGGSNNISEGNRNSVVINGGEIEIGDVYCGIYLGQGSELTILDGKFMSSSSTARIIHIGDNDAKADITGGTFNVDPSAYVAEGYEAVEKDGIWTVVKVEA